MPDFPRCTHVSLDSRLQRREHQNMSAMKPYWAPLARLRDWLKTLIKNIPEPIQWLVLLLSFPLLGVFALVFAFGFLFTLLWSVLIGWLLAKFMTEDEASKVVLVLGVLTSIAFFWTDKVESIFTSNASDLIIDYLYFCAILYVVCLVYLMVAAMFLWVMRYTVVQYALFALIALLVFLSAGGLGGRDRDCFLTVGRSGIVCE